MLNILLTRNIMYCECSILSRLALHYLPCLIEREWQSRSLESYSMKNTMFPDLIVCQGKCCQSKNEHNTIEIKNKIINFMGYLLLNLISMDKHSICSLYELFCRYVLNKTCKDLHTDQRDLAFHCLAFLAPEAQFSFQ